jgi:thiamine biosynthesis lipoprotein
MDVSPIRPGVRAKNPLRTFHFREEVMGTVVTIDVYDDDVSPQRLGLHVDAARAELHRADQIFSTWRQDTPMSRLRRGELGLDDAPPEVAEVLEQCLVARSLSGGWFDPWAMPGGVDPTGLVKGWAAQKALWVVAESGAAGVVVNAAGDVITMGEPAPGVAYRVGIQSPFVERELACVVEVAGALATSGTYQRGPHLIDPRSGQASCRVASASVCGPDLGLADALATALAVGGGEVLERLEALDGYHGLMFDLDGSPHATSEFPLSTAR